MHFDGTIRVGAAQINPILADLNGNLALHLDALAKGRARGLDLLVFPELSLTGYNLQQRVMTVAMTRQDPLLLELAVASGPMQSIVGFVESAGPGEYYNALATLHEGHVAHVHRKINLPTYGGLEEGKWFTPGESISLTPLTPDWLMSQWVCADLWNPGLVHAAMMHRPALLCAAINSASGIVSDRFSNEHNWHLNLSFYAMTYGILVIMANRFGPEGTQHFWGGSCIVSPTGKMLAQAEAQCTLIQAELRLEDIAQARFDLPTQRDGNNRLVQSLLP